MAVHGGEGSRPLTHSAVAVAVAVAQHNTAQCSTAGCRRYSYSSTVLPCYSATVLWHVHA
jgi:hypothetical protein